MNGETNGNGLCEKKKTVKKSSEVELDYDLHNPPPEVVLRRLKAISIHISHVQQSCALLGERLIEKGEQELGKQLIANGYIHDNSKFHGIEWLYLHDDIMVSYPDFFNAARLQHAQGNRHHPDAWNGIENMPRLYVAEMVCDWHGRSSEFGTDLRSYIKDKASKRYGFKTSGRVYKEIKFFVDMLLDKSFS